MELPWLQRYEPYLLALLRIVTGLLFLEHATQKFFAFPVPFPMQPLPTLFVAAGIIELVCGALITVGLFTRLAAFCCLSIDASLHPLRQRHRLDR